MKIFSLTCNKQIFPIVTAIKTASSWNKTIWIVQNATTLPYSLWKYRAKEKLKGNRQ